MSRAATLCDAYAARRLGVGSVGLCAECADVRCEEQGRKEGDTRDHWRSIVGSVEFRKMDSAQAAARLRVYGFCTRMSHLSVSHRRILS